MVVRSFLTVALIAIPFVAGAQTSAQTSSPTSQPPAPAAGSARNGNIWNGRDHQPDASTTRQAERTAGIAPSSRQQQSTDRELNAIGDQLIERSQRIAPPAR